MKSIFYPFNDSFMMLSPNPSLDVNEVARKDVPAGVPYIIFNNSDLPTGSFFNAWEIDFSVPHGYGIGHEAWFAEQEAKAKEAE